MKNLIRKHGYYAKKISILLIFSFALLLRLHHLDHESLWMDEIHQTSFYSHSFVKIVNDAAIQSQPPLDYWIGHCIHFILNSDFAVRLPAALFGAGSVVLLVMLISQLTLWPVACGFGIISALLPFNLYYSQEARPYAIAVFLFLCMFWALNRFLGTNETKKGIMIVVLLFFAVAFLYSRGLFPLVITACLLLILSLWFLILLKKTSAAAIENKRQMMMSCGTFILAMAFYIPSFRIILAKSGRYITDTAMGLSADRLLATVVQFDLRPIWQAFVVQSEPITVPLLILVCLSPFFGWQLHLPRKNTIWVLTTLLLPMACILNLVVFQAKSTLAFRPAYASYILPLSLILAAVSFQGLWSLTAKLRFAGIARAFMFLAAALFSFQAVLAAIDYKTMPRKSDWRGTANYLAGAFNSNHVLLFDSLSPYGAWEPTYYGFPRYYHGRSLMGSMAQIPRIASKLVDMPQTPILVLFQWKEYFLTPKSVYPIMSVPNAYMRGIDYRKLCQDPMLNCKNLTGFSIIQLKRKSNNLGRDTYTIIQRIIQNLPQGSWTVELQLAAAGLAQALGIEHWQDHLVQAELLADGNNSKMLSDVAARLKANLEGDL